MVSISLLGLLDGLLWGGFLGTGFLGWLGFDGLLDDLLDDLLWGGLLNEFLSSYNLKEGKLI